MTKVGKVTQIDRSKGVMKVMLEDQGDKEIESDWIVMSDITNDYPDIGSTVMVDFDNDDFSTGFCYGNHFHNKNKPFTDDENIIYYRFGKDMVFEYNKSTKELKIIANKVMFTGDVEIDGSLKANEVVADKIVEGGS